MSLDDKQIKIIQESTGHSVFGSSSLPRIVQCPGSVGRELQAGLQPTSIYAAKGTELHELTEKALRATDPAQYIHSLDIPIDDAAYVLDAVDYVMGVVAEHEKEHSIIPLPEENGKYDMAQVRAWVAEGKAVMLLEVPGSLESYGLPESYGTGDVVIMSSLRTDVIDHKFGHGVAVYATGNYQLVAYLGMAVPFVSSPDHDHKLFVHINQPTKQIFDKWQVEWDVLYRMLLGDVTDAIALARGDNPPYNPSVSACRFCAGNKTCKERHSTLMGQAKLIKRMANHPKEVSNEQWAKFLEASEALKAAIGQIEKYAVTQIQSGETFGDFKLVSGRSTRKFNDVDKAKELMKKRLGDKAYKPRDFITLAQAEKVDSSLKDDPDWLDLIHKPSGKPKLVRGSHKGKALTYGVKGLMNEMASGNL
jgi:hypothetical protein